MKWIIIKNKKFTTVKSEVLVTIYSYQIFFVLFTIISDTFQQSCNYYLVKKVVKLYYYINSYKIMKWN